MAKKQKRKKKSIEKIDSDSDLNLLSPAELSQLEADSARILAESPFLLESMPNSCNDPEIEETEIQDFRPEECATLPYISDGTESISEEASVLPGRKTERKRIKRGNKTYKEKIIECIKSSDTGSMLLQTIYKRMQDKYPDECTGDKENQWKNSIRHNLSLHKKVFKRVRTKQSEQHEWAYMENGGWSTAELIDSTDHVSPIKARKVPKRPRGVKPSDRMERKDWRQELVADAFLAHTACDMRGPTHELVLCRKDQVEILSRYYRNRGEIYLHKKLPQEARLPKNDSIAPHFIPVPEETHTTLPCLIENNQKNNSRQTSSPKVFQTQENMNFQKLPAKMLE